MATPSVMYQPLFPSPGLRIGLDIMLDSELDALILGAYATGTTGRDPLPAIEKAVSKGIPIFSIRQSRDDRWVTDWNEVLLPGKYESEAIAIVKGLIPLQKDLKNLEAVESGITKICSEYSECDDIIKTAMKTFSEDYWNDRINEIRAEHGLKPIEYKSMT